MNFVIIPFETTHKIFPLVKEQSKYATNASMKQSPRDLQICREGIDWIFCCGGNNPPTRVSGYFSPVNYFGYSLIRGPYSARACGNLAVVHALLGMKDAALTWLDAAQAHNPECVAMFTNNRDYTLNYAVNNHAKDACIELGIPYLDIAKSGATILKSMAQNYHPDPVPPDERNPPNPPTERHNGDRQHGGKNN